MFLDRGYVTVKMSSKLPALHSWLHQSLEEIQYRAIKKTQKTTKTKTQTKPTLEL